MWIKQLCNHKGRDFTMAFRVRKLFRTFKKRVPGAHFLKDPESFRGRKASGPFEKRAPGLSSVLSFKTKCTNVNSNRKSTQCPGSVSMNSRMSAQTSFSVSITFWWEVTHFVVNRLSYMEYYNGIHGILHGNEPVRNIIHGNEPGKAYILFSFYYNWIYWTNLISSV